MLEHKEQEPPAIFAVEDDIDAAHFHAEFTTMPLPRSVVDMSSERFLPRRVQSDAFRGFSFVHDDFLLPARDEQEEKSYWDSVEDDGESASECASSKMGEEEQVLEAEPPKKKRPPRKRKKKKGNANDETQSKTASSTPIGSAVNTPEPSISGETPSRDALEEDLVDNAVKASITNLETLSISNETELAVETATVEAPEKKDSNTLQPAPPRPPPKPAVESWQPVAKERGKKKHRSKAEVKAQKAENYRPQITLSTPSRHIPGASGNSTPSSNKALRPTHTPNYPTDHSGSSTGWGSALAQQQVPPQRPPPPTRSTDWRQHSMRGSPRTTPKPKPSGNVHPEAIVWPSLSSSSGQKPKQAAQLPTTKLSGDWAKRTER